MQLHPTVDRPSTRHLERLEVDRFVPNVTTVREIGPASVILDIAGTTDMTHTRLPENVILAGSTIENPVISVRIDAVSPNTFRYRVFEGRDAPDVVTPMLVGRSQMSEAAAVVSSEDRVIIETTAARLVIETPPLGPPLIRLHDNTGAEVTAIAGGEANFFGQWDSFPTGISRTPLADHRITTEVFSLGSSEAIYGFGETFGPLNKLGQTIDVNVEEALGAVTPRSYKSIPFWVSSGGWGAFLNHSARSTAWIGSRCVTHLQIAVDEPWLDMFVFVGSIPTVLAAYTELTGTPQMPPDWSFGFWQSKISYSSATEALEVATRMRAEDIPFDVLHLDTFWFDRDWYCDLEFSHERFPDPGKFLAQLAEMGVKVSLWQLPYIPAGSSYFEELSAADGFVRRQDGSIYDVGICYTPDWEGGTVGCIDFTNPTSCEIYRNRIAELFDLGASAIKADFGEQAPLDGVYHDGTPGHRAHNLYPLLYHQTLADITMERKGDSIMWARSAYAGSQRYPLHWGGDSSVRWDNLLANVSGGLSLGLSGFAFWSMDIGGFAGVPDDEILIRWLQAGLFLSHSRIHGFGNRELYDRGETTGTARRLLHLRYQLMPYLLAQARRSVARRVPLARALVVDHQHDPATWSIGDQWMLGDDLLVAPIANRAGCRRVYLPEGAWVHWFTGEAFSGPRWIEVQSPLEIFPLYQRADSIIPLGPSMPHVGARPTDLLLLRVAGDGTRVGRSTTAWVDGRLLQIYPRTENGGYELVVEGCGPDLSVTAVDQNGRDLQAMKVLIKS